MVTTLTSIAGTYGLPTTSNSPFGDVEKSVYDSVKSYLDEYRSSSLEGLTSRGLGRSTFGEQAMGKQESDIFSNLGKTFAENRLKNYFDVQDYNQQLGLLDKQSQLQQDLYNKQFQNKFGYDVLGSVFGLDSGGGIFSKLFGGK